MIGGMSKQNIKSMHIGEKLMMDRDTPYPDFDTKMENYKKGRICYPVIIKDINHKEDEYPILIKSSFAQGWVESNNKYLRKPTKEELETILWPKA
jgi:hypothetical protein